MECLVKQERTKLKRMKNKKYWKVWEFWALTLRMIDYVLFYFITWVESSVYLGAYQTS